MDPIVKPVSSSDVEETTGLFAKLSAGDAQAVQSMLSDGTANVNDVDEHGMTPLEHAAYRGNKDMCQLLLDCGASITEGTKNNGYTVLHFAALSGKADLCRFLLEHGAKAHPVNSVGRTAAQMAAFVGNHKCACTINSFIDRADIEYLTIPQGLETVPKLSPTLLNSAYNLILQINFHPVKLALFVSRDPLLKSQLQQVAKALAVFVEREMHKGVERNELMAMKVHLISHILLQLDLVFEGQIAKGNEPSVESFIKKLLKCDTPGGGVAESLDVLLRQGVRSFPFPESGIMQQLVTGLTQVKVCENPGAWGIISSVVNGQKGFKDNDPCSTCGEEEVEKRCGRCHYDVYCDKDCQKLHWSSHKKYCQIKAAEFEANRKKTETAAVEAAATNS